METELVDCSLHLARYGCRHIPLINPSMRPWNTVQNYNSPYTHTAELGAPHGHEHISGYDKFKLPHSGQQLEFKTQHHWRRKLALSWLKLAESILSLSLQYCLLGRHSNWEWTKSQGLKNYSLLPCPHWFWNPYSLQSNEYWGDLSLRVK
jgi:hypothetical protein